MRRLVLVFASMTVFVAAAWGQEKDFGEAADLLLLKEHDVAPDIEGVRLFLDPPATSEEDVKLARLYARQLGSEKFAEREAATQKLLAMELDALEAIQHAAQSQDAETRARARGILARLTRLQERRQATLPAVLRTIVRRELKGLAPQVLRAAPQATTWSSAECLRRALWTTVQAEDAPALRQALTEGAPASRIAAALALPAALGEAAREDLLPLLAHDDAATRLAAAQGLAPYAREESFQVLLEGLESADLPVRIQAAQILYALTGEPIDYAAYASPERRTAGVARWRAWLADQGQQAPLGQPLAAGPLPKGRYLACHFDPFSVSERDESGRAWFRRQSLVPEDEAYCGCTISPEGYRVLAGFGSVVAFRGDGEGNEVWRVSIPEMPATVDLTPEGTYLIGLFDEQEIREVQPNGEIVRQVKLTGSPNDVRYLAPGRWLVCLYSTKQIVEIDEKGEITWSIDNVPPPESARRLTNGNTLVATALGKVIEYAPDGEVVWTYGKELPLAYDAVELPNGNVLIGYRYGLREIDRTGFIVHEATTSTVRRICAY